MVEGGGGVEGSELLGRLLGGALSHSDDSFEVGGEAQRHPTWPEDPREHNSAKPGSPSDAPTTEGRRVLGPTVEPSTGPLIWRLDRAGLKQE